MIRPRFDDGEPDELRELGVTPEQIKVLEKILPRILWASQSVGTTAVRERLASVKDAAHILAAALMRLERGKEPAAREAAGWLYESHTGKQADDHLANPLQSHYPDNPDPDALRVEIERLEYIAGDALKGKGGRQARGRLGSPRPVSWIDDALLQGWAETYAECVYDGDDAEWLEQIRNGTLTEKSPPEYPFAPSNSGAFRKIVQICYQAAGHPAWNSERTLARAINAYVAEERARFGWIEEWSGDSGNSSQK